MVVTIHQPEHLPWLGFFDKVRQSDVLVLLDHVQFRKNYFQNRNRILSDKGPMWLTVPVLTRGKPTQSITEVRIDNRSSPRWKEKCWSGISQHYSKADYWSNHEKFFDDLYDHNWDRLVDLNESIIRYILTSLFLGVRIIKSSEMKVKGSKGDLLLSICREVGADIYLSGVSGKSYLDLDVFSDSGIDVCFQEFYHPIYKQVYEPFTPRLSAIDLLFNCGLGSSEVLKGVGVKTMDHIFE